MIILICVMVFSYILTQVMPMGSFSRAIHEGREVIVPGSYTVSEDARLPLWRLFTAPFEVFLTADAATAVMIILFIMLIGGVFLIFEKCGLLHYAMHLVIQRFAEKKYVLLAAVTFFGMVLGSTMGLFEETVILTPITVALAISLGWDALVGVGMSVLAVGFGFSASTFNPFTTGVAQKLAGLPLYSGLWLRFLVFIVVYLILFAFLLMYAKRIDKNPKKSLMYGKQTSSAIVNEEATLPDPVKSKKAFMFFGCCLAAIAVYIAAGIFVPDLSSYSMPVMALLFTIGGIGAGFLLGYKRVIQDFLKGMVSFLPSAVLLMLAMSVKHIIISGGIMDTLLQYAYEAVNRTDALMSLYIIFLVVLCFNFFIGGAASKAFLVIPLLAPLAELIGLTRQSIVLAFCFGDGFSNMLYPTNAVLLITLGIIGIPYITWFRWTWKIQAFTAVLCLGFLFIAHATGYGPF
jgi:uncharacterized ion transporter superfamily protein YfcC